MPQFIVAPENIKGNTAILSGADVKHLIKVLRHKEGDKIFLSDGQHRYRALIESIRPKEVRLKLIESVPVLQPSNSPVLALPLLKSDKLKMILQKGVELGVSEFILFSSTRTIPRLDFVKTETKMRRLQKIADAARIQSGMIATPKINPPLEWDPLLRQFARFSSVLVASEEENLSFQSVFQTLQPEKLLLLIGPEGGWATKEIAEAKQAGAKTVGLGGQILRSETAAILLVSLCQYELGNL